MIREYTIPGSIDAIRPTIGDGEDGLVVGLVALRTLVLVDIFQADPRSVIASSNASAEKLHLVVFPGAYDECT